MKIFSSLGEWAHGHRTIFAIIVVCLIAALGAGGWFGFQEYQRRQSAAYAVEKIQAALQPPDTHKLAMLVDFNTISRELAEACRHAFPFLHAGEDQLRKISHRVQSAVLAKFLEKQSKGSQFPEDESKLAKLSKPLHILPQDFAEQLATNVRVEQTDPNNAVAIVRINNPQLERDFIMNFGLRRGPDGWVVRHLLNAHELASQAREALLERYAGLREVYEEKNAITKKEMDTALPIKSCSANAGTLSDGKTFLLVVHAIAHNDSDVQINNFNLDTTIRGKSGNVIVHRFLNAALPVGPGTNFDHSWTFDLDYDSPVAQELLRDGPLQCEASWQTLSLNNGKVLHMAQVPNPARPCDKPGHKHPADFCALPIFLR